MIKISVIGKSGHAARHISLIKEIEGISLDKVLYYKDDSDSDLPLTKDISDLFNSDGIILSSPTDTHQDYLKDLATFEGKVLIEKPGYSTNEELNSLIEWDVERKKRVKINYNFKNSPLAKKIKDIVSNEEYGKCLSVNIQTGHGLAYKESYQTNWRNSLERSAGVAELVGSHYLNFIFDLFGPYTQSNYLYNWGARKDKNVPPDYFNINGQHKCGLISNLSHSYATPFHNKISLTFTDAILNYDGEKLELFHPRDSFDELGRFTSPNLICSEAYPFAENWKNGFRNSVENFGFAIKEKSSFNPDEFNDDLLSYQEILNLKKELRGSNV